MAQWFHRNPLKATSVGNFELPSSNGKSQTIIRFIFKCFLTNYYFENSYKF